MLDGAMVFGFIICIPSAFSEFGLAAFASLDCY